MRNGKMKHSCKRGTREWETGQPDGCPVARTDCLLPILSGPAASAAREIDDLISRRIEKAFGGWPDDILWDPDELAEIICRNLAKHKVGCQGMLAGRAKLQGTIGRLLSIEPPPERKREYIPCESN